MSAPVVADASVALKWTVNEPFTTQAEALLVDASEQGRHIVGPSILRAEVANALYQRLRRGDVTYDKTVDALATFLAIPIRIVTPPNLYSEALDLARRYNLRATYDALYLATARAIEGEFWTADERLIEALPRSIRWVHHIRDYSSPGA